MVEKICGKGVLSLEWNSECLTLPLTGLSLEVCNGGWAQKWSNRWWRKFYDVCGHSTQYRHWWTDWRTELF